MKEIPLTRGYVALVDDEDYEWLAAKKWQVRFPSEGRAYAQRVQRLTRGSHGPRVTIQMHRAIMRAPKGVQVDHVNGDSLDNRKSNLRFCTHGQNIWNQRGRKVRVSKFKGVSPFRPHGRLPWRARITADKRTITIGYYKTEIEAARAWDAKAIELHGPFARLNFPPALGETG